jgi:acetyl-CoA C-acetyltransferase
MPEPVIIDVLRSPIGRAFKGSLASLRPDDALAQVVDALLKRNGSPIVDELAAGCGLPQGVHAFNIARAAVLLSETLDASTPGITLSRFCASGVDALRYAANAIAAGEGDTYVAGGVEFVSSYNASQETMHPEDRNPRDLEAYVEMGVTAENVAERYGVSRAAQDEYAQRSQERARAAQTDGFFAREIVPLELPDGTLVDMDDGPRASSTLERLSALRTPFKKDGTVTSGNSCPLNDGAAAALVMSRERADELGLTPRARIVASATWANDPGYMGVAPIGAVERALDRARMKISDIEVVELNEAFAAQVLPVADAIRVDHERLNPHGGAIALGHPFGMTGVRILATLLNGLDAVDGTIGLEAMCVAGGQGEAIIVERLG